MANVMILLDDAQSTADQPSSRLYQQALNSWSIPTSLIAAENILATTNCLEQISAALARGEYVVAAFSYELGRQLHGLPQRPSKHPLLQAWSFASYDACSKNTVDIWLQNVMQNLEPGTQTAGVMHVKTSLDEKDFIEDIATIQEYILSGDAYQINHTYRVHGQVYGDPLALYSRLRKRQPGRFGAFIRNGNQFILSQSPELFIQRTGHTLKTMPMKGTANALTESATALASDQKNQAENVMIVDLLRNDLSRLSIPGTVAVSDLFEVARYGDVLQMTSTVQAQIRPDLSLMDILTAIFPCGSITGAPKRRSMEIIQELESEDRGYYCGAIGWLDPDSNFALSVPIRTLEIERNPLSAETTFTLGIGAGITIDSQAQQEWQECQTKSGFLTQLPSAAGLFESILIQDSQAQRLEAHLARMASSAHALGIPFDAKQAKDMITQTCASQNPQQLHRLRLDLNSAGNFSVRTETLEPLRGSVQLFWAKDVLANPAAAVMHSGDVLLQHKTDRRSTYDAAWQAAVHRGGFDALFINEEGFVTEGGRTSVFIKPKQGNEWLTPPLSAGVLPGIMRNQILSDPIWKAREANLTIDDVVIADEIILTNALRGVISAHF
jgi:para-aminobenzoate synthetase/4-amino-4-deoxychorismate lyase